MPPRANRAFPPRTKSRTPTVPHQQVDGIIPIPRKTMPNDDLSAADRERRRKAKQDKSLPEPPKTAHPENVQRLAWRTPPPKARQQARVQCGPDPILGNRARARIGQLGDGHFEVNSLYCRYPFTGGIADESPAPAFYQPRAR